MKSEITIPYALGVFLTVVFALALLFAFFYIFTVGDISKFNSIGGVW